ncbi:MAG: bifunctional DNA primase/polymerase [Candidatus Dormibacteraeota bacterium]|nr:bifunctional DNA primase/polymerase [Candidatus Dormibacteraeota bacterium]
MTRPASAPVEALTPAGGLSLPEAAVAYARAGLLVFPCVAGEKRPLTEHGFIDASSDPARVASWWRRWPQATIGVATGRPGGFDVLDIDVHPGGSGFPALRRARQAGLVDRWAVLVRSPSGGVHLYFPADVEREQRSWALPRKHVDFRGAGGYVIAPPSRISDGHGRERGYRLIATGRDPQAVEAAELRRRLDPPRPRPRMRPGIGLAAASGERLGAWRAVQPEGNRNRALFWAARRQAEAGVPQDEARQVLGSAAERTGLGEREIDATLASAYRATTHRHDAPATSMATGALGR